MDTHALDQFCGSKFWDTNLTWHSPDPDFTECFQNTVLVWVPCAFLWVFAPLEIYLMRTSTRAQSPYTQLTIAKLGLTLVLGILAVVDLGMALYVRNFGTVYDVEYCTPSVKIITFVLAASLLLGGKKYGRLNSGVIFIFWLLLVIFGIVQFRSSVKGISAKGEPTYSIPAYIVYFVISCIIFLLHFFADAKPSTSKTSESQATWSREHCSFPSNLLFVAFDMLAWRGFKKPLELEDLWTMSYKDTTEGAITKLAENWKTSSQTTDSYHYVKATLRKASGQLQLNHAERKKRVSMVCALWNSFQPMFLAGAVFKFFEGALSLATPLILKWFIDFVSSEELVWKGYMYAALFLVVKFLWILSSAHHARYMFIVGLRIRTALTGAIYQKSLKLGNAARKNWNIGEIVNLMSVDVQSFMDFVSFIHCLWEAPLEIAAALYFLWNILGVAMFAGVGVMVVAIPFHAALTAKLMGYNTEQMDRKDARVRLISEILNGIKVLKLYAWESSFKRHISRIRNQELVTLRKYLYCIGTMIFIWTFAPALVCFTALTTFVLIDDTRVLDAQTVFVSLSLFNLIQYPMIIFPEVIGRLIQTMVSMRRIDNFLNSDELDPNNVQHDQLEVNALVIENGKFAWTNESSVKPILQNINLTVKPKQLIAIVGSVGSGKSSLLSAFLGDMDRLSGRVNLKGTVAYVSQQAWIQNASVRDNILFGSPFDKKLYDKIIDACALRPDLDMLAGGDRTEIGEKGINLSGGQKQRVSLARAVYNSADVYLFDDPLSAVDAHVGKHIFERVVGPNGVLREKTRVLVTHGISFLPQVDNIIVLKNGEITERGTYDELLKSTGAFAEFLLHYLQDVDPDTINEEDELSGIKQTLESTIGPKRVQEQLTRPRSPAIEIHSDIGSSSEDHDLNSCELVRQQSVLKRRSSSTRRKSNAKDEMISEFTGNEKCIEAEFTEHGKVKFSVYMDYLRSVGFVVVVLAFVTRFGYEACSIAGNMWLSAWTGDNTTMVNGTVDAAKRTMYLEGYGGLMIGQAIFIMANILVTSVGGLKASKQIHAKLLNAILRAPVTFFDVTPSGRILNRFGKDMDVVDNILPRIIKSWLVMSVSTLGTLVVISYGTPIFIVIVVVMGVLYYFIQCFYLASCRQLSRLESITRSPIYTYSSESIAGSSTIRAYRAQERFIKESRRRIDINQVCSYSIVIADRWLAIRLGFLGSVVVFFSALFAVFQKDTLSAGVVGLTVTYALQITNFLEWMVRSSSEVESKIVSVERIEEYDKIEQEAPWEITDNTPPNDWPQEGRVEFVDYKVRYREGLELALRGLSFSVMGGERVGIVGRTGAGKSSLTLALFRIIESAGGKIFIDGVDISTIGLHSLRSKLTIIPQDPVLFSGNLRLNLDPFEKYSDEEVWKALEHAHLKTFAQGLKGGLLHEIDEGGDNLSVGQRQLICLARALLRKTKVLILDEATASVDMETDDFIQRTIREEFKECTVLTIAHRLNTILDSDKVLVLDKGRMLEFDPPDVLLQRKNSVFYSMARDAGIVA